MVIVLCLVIIGMLTWSLIRTYEHNRVATEAQEKLATMMRNIEGEVTRTRIEQATGRTGVDALIERMRHYSSLVSSARETKPDYAKAKKEIDAAFLGFANLGPKSYPAIRDAFLGAAIGEEYDLRKQLLVAMSHADPESAKTFIARVLRGYDIDVPVSTRIRPWAAQVLRGIDANYAGDVLAQILSYETSRGGPNEMQLPAAMRSSFDNQARVSQGLHNLVGEYLLTEHFDLEKTLEIVLRNPEHDRVTKQEAVKALGLRGAAAMDAAPVIRELFLRPPDPVNRVFFQRHCLQSLASIEGSALCEFIQEQREKQHDEVVRSKLDELAKELGCN